jgi:hypothetical protein
MSTDVTEENVSSTFRVSYKSQARNQHESEIGDMTFNRLHGVISQKTEPFVTFH